MALETLTVREPDFGARASRKPNVVTTKFGDGYSQRAAQGLNSLAPTWTLAWNHMTIAEADALDNFLIARGGHEAFYWTPPRGTVTKWICQEWEREAELPYHDNITATFTQVFDLVVPPD